MSEIIISVLVISVLSLCVGGMPYANNYPHKSHGYSYSGGNTGGDSEGGTDIMGYVKNHVSDKGNDLKSSIDSGKFSNIENVQKGHDINQMKHGAVTDAQRHTIGENLETDKSHNRKQVKSGFHNSYHKDESGSNSSYFEDSDDHDGKLVYNKRHRQGGDAYDSKYNEGVRDGSQRDRHDDRYGGYDTRGSHDREHLVAENQGNRHGHRDGYTRGQGDRFETYNDDRAAYPVQRYSSQGSYGLYRPIEEHGLYRSQYGGGGGDQRGLGGVGGGFNGGGHATRFTPAPINLNANDDEYYNRPRITIYEDPRDLIDPRNDRRVDYGRIDQYIPPRLDVRPSPIHYRNYDEGHGRDRYRDY